MSEQTFKQHIMPNLREQLRNTNWPTGPSLIAEHTDPHLSIADYYRAQQARGINATPQPETFIEPQIAASTES